MDEVCKPVMFFVHAFLCLSGMNNVNLSLAIWIIGAIAIVNLILDSSSNNCLKLILNFK